MTDLQIPVHLPSGEVYTLTTAQPVIDDDGVGFMSARAIQLIVGSLAEEGLFVARGDGGYDSLLTAGALNEALRLIRAVLRVDRALPPR